ncbi:transcription-repair coupling factor [Geobacter argillaceus]|uniref:Transcription-repair-coupling factor n=1 Tax=Geobacter argillaceus TaxID=345631 RepID=A0A562VM32_9BACT|nr:transcription-repair coupling factor [Geobacter argillaceus]TWJ18945.1 transcription-repair coupling factor [Geobacter argillaceus]
MIAPADTLLKKLLSALNPAQARVRLSGLHGSAPAFVLSFLAERKGGPLVIVTADSDTAAELCQELRFYSARPEAIHLFPSWDTQLLENVSPHPDVTGERLATLSALMNGSARAVVTPWSALSQRVIPRQVLGDASLYLVAGEELDREALLQKLVNLGYAPVPLVEDRGTFAVRGGILDIFPPALPSPVRVEFFGDFVETIRTFDPLSQRSLHPLAELVLLPSREVILMPASVQAFAARLKRRCDDLDIPVVRRRELMEQLQNDCYPAGVEFLQPMFHGPLETLFNYAGADCVTILVDPEGVVAAREAFAADLARAEQRALEHDRIFAPLEELYCDADAVETLIGLGRRVTIPALELSGTEEDAAVFRFDVQDNRDLRIDLAPDSEGVLRPLATKLQGLLAAGVRPFLPCHQQGQAQRLLELLTPYGLPLHMAEEPFADVLARRDQRVEVMVGELSRGCRLPEFGVAIIAEEEIFGQRVRRRGVSELKKKQVLTSLAELKPGDPMVHLEFGVGIYRGLQHLALGGVAGDFLLLEYAGGDKLYLPVDRLGLVQRYVGAEGLEPRIDRLGGSSWEKAKAKARQAIEEMADELLQLYAARQIQEGIAFSPPDDLYKEFEASFAYEETPDQLSAIEDVLSDMQHTRPMDRLICGDVGYGKTEVAMRGAFKAVMDGRQVAVLVPTTVLAQQHMESFRERFKAYPVKVEMLSRFRTPKEQKAILEGVQKGNVDIIIGTHRLLQKDVTFKELGLLIVDEEQRFGVAHKERLKKYRATVDIMTLTATPIPRTLYMSMMGIRDLSIIDTPPVDRLAIKTFVARFNDELIREAVLRELRRGGQIFFVHNRVQSIGAMAEHLQRIVPEARIAVGHGQMNEGELEKVMLGFMHGETNLLLCTTIIESGLDIPSANTLIVNRADAFGLAQLYQLRGRVGRSKVRAYAYFLIPAEGAIPPDARERLKILQEITELGAGFRIATHDLEIRGAGDLLGGRQSGQIAAVGFELYTELLEEAIQRLKGEETVERVEPEIKLRIPAFIPEEYVPDANQRLVLYKKLTQAQASTDIDDVLTELVDRFGKLPPAAGYLLEVMRLRLRLKELLIREVEFDGQRLIFSFHQKTPVSPDTIIALIRQQPKKYQFTPEFRLVVELPDTGFDGVLTEARNVLNRLV